MSDFIIENGLITEYIGPKSGDIVIPEEAKGFYSLPVFIDIMEGPFSLTLSSNMECRGDDLMAQEIVVLNIPSGAIIADPGFNSYNGSPFFKNLKEVNVAPDHAELSSENGILYNKDKSVLISCPRALTGKVVIPDSVVEIKAEAFYGCALVTEVVLPEGITEIGERTFADCKALKKIVLPDGVKAIGAEAFLRCAKLTTAGLKGTGDKKGYTYEFPWTDAIPENAFNGMRSLKTVVLPDTIKEIGKNAFKACRKLEQINLPADVKFDKKAFKDCKLLSMKGDLPMDDFTIQRGYLVSYRGTGAHVDIPEGVTSIGRRAFYMCKAVSAVLPESLTEIEPEAFALSALEQVEIRGTIKKIGAGAFPYGESLERCLISEIPLSAFSKADCEHAVLIFLEHEQDVADKVRTENIAFIGKNLLRLLESKQFLNALKNHPAMLEEVVKSGKIPAKDMDALIQRSNLLNDTALTALLLSGKKPIEAKKDDFPCLDSAEPSVADWRKLYSFKYVDGGVEITGCMDNSDEIKVPEKIGTRLVRTIGRHAFDGHVLPDKESFEKRLEQKRTITLPESVTCVRHGAFYCVNNREIFLPESLTELPSGMLIAVDHVVLHVPKNVAVIPDDLVWDSPDGAVEIVEYNGK